MIETMHPKSHPNHTFVEPEHYIWPVNLLRMKCIHRKNNISVIFSFQFAEIGITIPMGTYRVTIILGASLFMDYVPRTSACIGMPR